MQAVRTTPPAMAAELGLTQAGVRAWLKRHGHIPDPDGYWRIDPATEAEMRAYFAGRASPPPVLPCTVVGCDRTRMSQRAIVCQLHHERMRKHGSYERREPGENQRAKTHCPSGHPYTSENTVIYAEGRRRCLTCVRKRARENARRRRAAAAATPRPTA
ncbi:hypothetical protein [Isoptericola sp. NPDC056134]|uniref:hypothetical protein n=1 Tax=Isoptericola sp. NPDC056134 TaxID=3345723 RepID=UPI0035E70530